MRIVWEEVYLQKQSKPREEVPKNIGPGRDYGLVCISVGQPLCSPALGPPYPNSALALFCVAGVQGSDSSTTPCPMSHYPSNLLHIFWESVFVF